MRLNPAILATAVAFISGLEDLVAAYNNDILQSKLTDSTTNPDILQNDVSDAEQVATQDRPFYKHHATGKRHVPVTFSTKGSCDDDDESSATNSHIREDDTPSESEVNEYLNSLHSTYGSAMDDIFSGLEDSVDIFSTGDDADDNKPPSDNIDMPKWLSEVIAQASSQIPTESESGSNSVYDELAVKDPHPVKWSKTGRDQNSLSFVDATSDKQERAIDKTLDDGPSEDETNDIDDDYSDEVRRLVVDDIDPELDPDTMDGEDIVEMLENIQHSVNVLNLKADRFIELSKKDSSSYDIPKRIKTVIQDPLKSLKRQTKSVELSSTGSDQGKFEALLQDIQVSADELESKAEALMNLSGNSDDDKHVYSFKKPISDPVNKKTNSILGDSSDSGADHVSLDDYEDYLKNRNADPLKLHTNDVSELDERSDTDLDTLSNQPADPLNDNTKSTGSNQGGLENLLQGIKTSGVSLENTTNSWMNTMGIAGDNSTTGAALLSGLKQSVTDPLSNKKDDLLNSSWANPIDTMKDNVKNSITDPLKDKTNSLFGFLSDSDSGSNDPFADLLDDEGFDALLKDVAKPSSDGKKGGADDLLNDIMSDSDSGSGFEDFLSSLFNGNNKDAKKDPKGVKDDTTEDEDFKALMGLDEDDAGAPTGAGALAAGAAAAPASASTPAQAASSNGSGSGGPPECQSHWQRMVSWFSNMGLKKHVCTVPQRRLRDE